MSAAPVSPAAPSPFRAWLRQELIRELKLSAIFLAIGLTLVLLAPRVSDKFTAAWTRFNSQLTSVALTQHPTALLGTFSDRLSAHEYGWGLFSWTAPFNVTDARERLRADFPEFVGVDAEGRPVTLRGKGARRNDAANQEARAQEWLAQRAAIESHRFTRLYAEETPLDVPSATDRLARLTTKLLGLPDGLLHLLHTIVASGVAGILLASGTLGIAAAALWSSHRPARRWLKVLLCPVLASALGWVTIFCMSVAAALFGGITANTSALAVFACAPLIYLAAKAPLRLFEDLQLKPKPWDGVERRRGPRA